MTLAPATPAVANRTLAAAAAIAFYAVVIGFTDNYVRVIAQDLGLWQFHAMRTAFVLAIVLLVWPVRRPRNLRAVVARSLVHASAMLLYFATLAFLPVAQVAAGLFTAPVFVLLISRFVHGERIGPVRIVAVALGFAGTLLVLGPGAKEGIGPASLVPVLSGLIYAVSNLATRRWCPGESAATLTLGFFVALGFYGLVGVTVLTLWPQAAPPGLDGFVLRGFVPPPVSAVFWVFVQALGSLLGVMAMVRAYQLADASRVAVFEYVVLPAAVVWGVVLWGETPSALAVAGMGLIFAAGLMIALRRGQAACADCPAPKRA